MVEPPKTKAEFFNQLSGCISKHPRGKRVKYKTAANTRRMNLTLNLDLPNLFTQTVDDVVDIAHGFQGFIIQVDFGVVFFFEKNEAIVALI
mmetsp:Transcript_54222/g.62096  ORF Transcript_54222/g.62096 Transcript_54222/m.62096 type:complete len:91 (-) Transcript_54222:1189-1461(-)